MACLLSIALLVCLSAQYLSFVSKTIYAESTQHLGEVLHKSNNMLSMIVKKNTSYLHVWNGFLSSDPDDASTQAYLESAQQQLGFAEFYFLSYDGNYMTPSGKTGYLGLQSNLDKLLSDQKDVVLNTALPGQDPMLVFICPETKGIYRGFAYDAIAIGHYNNVVMKAVDDSAFGGAASSFVIYPDGQVVIENISEDSESIYNFIAILQEYSDLTEAQIQELTDDFAQGITGNREVTLDGTRFYLVYESTGIQQQENVVHVLGQLLEQHIPVQNRGVLAAQLGAAPVHDHQKDHCRNRQDNEGYDLHRALPKLVHGGIDGIPRDKAHQDPVLDAGAFVDHIIDDSWLYGVVEYELIPLLKEYWFDEPMKVKDWSENLRSTIK